MPKQWFLTPTSPIADSLGAFVSARFRLACVDSDAPPADLLGPIPFLLPWQHPAEEPAASKALHRLRAGSDWPQVEVMCCQVFNYGRTHFYATPPVIELPYFEIIRLPGAGMQCSLHITHAPAVHPAMQRGMPLGRWPASGLMHRDMISRSLIEQDAVTYGKLSYIDLMAALFLAGYLYVERVLAAKHDHPDWQS